MADESTNASTFYCFDNHNQFVLIGRFQLIALREGLAEISN